MAYPPSQIDPFEERIRFVQQDLQKSIPTDRIVQQRVCDLSQKTESVIRNFSSSLIEKQEESEQKIVDFREKFEMLPFLNAGENKVASLEESLGCLKKLQKELHSTLDERKEAYVENIHHKQESEQILKELNQTIRDQDRHGTPARNFVYDAGRRVCQYISNSSAEAEATQEHWQEYRGSRQQYLVAKARDQFDQSTQALQKTKPSMQSERGLSKEVSLLNDRLKEERERDSGLKEDEFRSHETFRNMLQQVRPSDQFNQVPSFLSDGNLE